MTMPDDLIDPDALPPVERLRSIMRLLRSDRGCPWDREQTLDTLKRYLVEETYEVIDAIDGGDRALLKEELGDLLLQVVFQSQLCEDSEVVRLRHAVGAAGAPRHCASPGPYSSPMAGNSMPVLEQTQPASDTYGLHCETPPRDRPRRNAR